VEQNTEEAGLEASGMAREKYSGKMALPIRVIGHLGMPRARVNSLIRLATFTKALSICLWLMEMMASLQTLSEMFISALGGLTRNMAMVWKLGPLTIRDMRVNMLRESEKALENFQFKANWFTKESGIETRCMAMAFIQCPMELYMTENFTEGEWRVLE
jgi:hypothetical protein